MFTLKHQDGDIQYELETGCFVIIDSKLYLSIEAKAIDANSFPDCYLFTVNAYPLKSSFKNTKIEMAINPKDEPPNIHVYTTFHACEVYANIDITIISDNEIEVNLNISSEDVSYYNEQAQPNSFEGIVRIPRKTLSEIWLP